MTTVERLNGIETTRVQLPLAPPKRADSDSGSTAALHAASPGSAPGRSTSLYSIMKRLHRLAVRTLGFHPRNRSSTLLGGAIRCLGSSIGRAADSRRLVSKENTSNGGGCAIHPAASIICGLRVRFPPEVPA